MADVVLPASASLVRGRGGTVTNSERRVQRVRKALDPPGQARDDMDHLRARRAGSATTGASRRSRRSGTSCASLSPMHGGMSYARLEELGGIQWPCSDEDHPGLAVPARPAVGRARRGAARAVLGRRTWAPPIDALDDDFPIRLTTGRRLDSYNTGVQSGRYSSPLRRGETLDLRPEDADALGVGAGRARAGQLAARLGRCARAHRHAGCGRGSSS